MDVIAASATMGKTPQTSSYVTEELGRQCSIQGCEQEKDMWYCALSQAEPCLSTVQGEGKAEFNLELTGASNA